MQGPNFSLDGKVALVTGASRGIGASVAAAIAHAGAAVALIARESPALDVIHDALAAQGHTVMRVAADVGDVARIDAAFDTVLKTLGRIDILINNAGIEQICPSRDVTESLWDRIVDTNLKGAFFCAQAAARRMAPGASIVNLCSLTSEIGIGRRRALRGLQIGSRRPDSRSRDRVGGRWHSGQRSRSGVLSHRAHRAVLPGRASGSTPCCRRSRCAALGSSAAAAIPAISAARVVFLCSDAAAYITGQILYVDGGYLASL